MTAMLAQHTPSEAEATENSWGKETGCALWVIQLFKGTAESPREQGVDGQMNKRRSIADAGARIARW